MVARVGKVDVVTNAELKMPADILALWLLECHVVTIEPHILVTLLFGTPADEQVLADTLRSLVWLIGPNGRSEIWRPGKDYPGSSIWFAEPETGILLGNDFHKPDAVYACKLDGTHIASFSLPLLWDNPIQPWRFKATQKGIEYVDTQGKLQHAADIAQLILRAKGTADAMTSRLAADWRPRALLLPTNIPGGDGSLFRLTRNDDHLGLDCLRATRRP